MQYKNCFNYLRDQFGYVFLLGSLSAMSLSADAQYEDVTIDAGILHAHANPSLLGGGAAFFDYDLDGWIDIYMTGGRDEDRLYRNLGGNNFADRSDLLPHNSGKTAITSSVTTGDINNDGCTDIVITTFSKEDPTIVLMNNCDGTFSEMTNLANLQVGPGTGAALFDFNHDGLLDLYVINFIDEHVFIKDDDGNVIGFDHLCYPNQFYKNMGDFVFEDITEQYQIGGNGCALALAVLPLEDEKWGLYIANDFGEFIVPNQLFVYDAMSDSFEEKSEEYGLDVAVYGMGIAIGDYDNDMDYDVYVTNMGQNAFMENEDGIYVDKAVEYGVDDTFTTPPKLSTGWGTFFFDMNNDADLDLFIANGFVNAAEFIPTSLVNSCKLFVNTGDGEYFDLTEQSNVGISTINRGCIYGDTDNDGDLDIVIANTIFGGSYDYNASYRLLENQLSVNNYLKIELEGVESNHQAFGAQLVLHVAGEMYLQYLFSSGTYASQSTSIVHFGLGTADNVDSLKIMWPSGLTTMHYGLPGNQMVHIKEGSGGFNVVGCMDSEDPNYNPLATINGGCAVETTGFRELTFDAEAVEIYPTLSEGRFFVSAYRDLGKCRLEAIDANGRRIDSKELDLLSGETREVVIASGFSGICFLHLISPEVHFTTKVVIAR